MPQHSFRGRHNFTLVHNFITDFYVHYMSSRGGSVHTLTWLFCAYRHVMVQWLCTSLCDGALSTTRRDVDQYTSSCGASFRAHRHVKVQCTLSRDGSQGINLHANKTNAPSTRDPYYTMPNCILVHQKLYYCTITCTTFYTGRILSALDRGLS